MQKWEVIRVYCDFLADPHDKFCICICPESKWFMFVNSDPPEARKARGLAISIENYEAHFLNHLSYVDTTKLQDVPDPLLDAALQDPERNHGFLPPSLRTRIMEAVAGHDVLPPAQRAKVLEG